MKSLIVNGDSICPPRSTGLSNWRRISEVLGDDEQFSHVETITDGDESESLMYEPGQTATVLAHNDLAVVGPGVHWPPWGVGHNLRSST